MYKLLPEKEKSKVYYEYRFRRVLMITTLSIALLMFGIGTLVPSLVLALAKKNSAELLSSSAANSMGNDPELLSWAVREQRLVAWLAPAEQKLPYESVLKALKAKPAGIKISSLVWSTGKDGALKISGIAKDRDTLTRFQGALGASGDWNHTDLPVGNLAKDTDINFELTLTPK